MELQESSEDGAEPTYSSHNFVKEALQIKITPMMCVLHTAHKKPFVRKITLTFTPSPISVGWTNTLRNGRT